MEYGTLYLSNRVLNTQRRTRRPQNVQHRYGRGRIYAVAMHAMRPNSNNTTQRDEHYGSCDAFDAVDV